MIIEKSMGLGDLALVKAIAEDPYCKRFIGIPQFVRKCPFAATTLVAARKRLAVEPLTRLNEALLKVEQSLPKTTTSLLGAKQ